MSQEDYFDLYKITFTLDKLVAIILCWYSIIKKMDSNILCAICMYTHLVNKCPHADPQYINSYAIICIAPGDCGHLL
jgi:hypothetical protein